MGMTPEAFFECFVETNAADCSESPGDLRRAFNAAVAASHFADHYHAFSKRHSPAAVSAFPSVGSFVEHLSKETGGAFLDIRSIANAYKHLYTDVGKGSTYWTVSSAGSIDTIELTDDEYLESISEDFVNDVSEEGSRLAVIFNRLDGTSSEFLPTLETVLAHFRSMVY